MKILSLFDGISCARVALERAGIPVEAYYASEIDKYAIQISQKNYPDIKHIGSVTEIKGEVLHLSGVYDRIKLHDNNIQDKLSKSEMLYWLNQNFSISAKIGTQIKNADTPESTSLQCVEEIWFSKRGMGDIIKTRKPERSRGDGKENDTTIQVPILQCGDWWYVYRSDTRDTEENIYRAIGEKIEEVIYRENKTVSIKTVQHTGSEGQTIKADKESNVETRDTKEILVGNKKPTEWRIEAIRNREQEARNHIQDISSQLSRWNDNERITEENWNLLQLHQEMETTLVTSSQSINISLGRLDYLCGGSPCQDLSIAKKDRKGLDGERSSLFWEYVRILREVKPKYFILENVASMPKEAKEIITRELGVEPIMINAALVSAQNRKRLFWTNIPNVTLPEDRGILLKDILEKEVDEKYNVYSDNWRVARNTVDVNHKSRCLNASNYKGALNDGMSLIKIGQIGSGGQGQRIYSPEGKSTALSALGGGQGAKTGLYLTNEQIRKLTPVECERLQGLPDNYTEGISNTQRYKTLGNAFNVDVVAHILSFIPR